MKHYHDWGRVVVGSKKDFYKLKDGTFKVYLSKLWPKKTIQHQDRLTRYLIEQFRSNFKPILLTEDKQEVEESLQIKFYYLRKGSPKSKMKKIQLTLSLKSFMILNINVISMEILFLIMNCCFRTAALIIPSSIKKPSCHPIMT